MKIIPKSKKTVPPPTQIAELISNILNASNDRLVEVIKDVDSWKWPRSDLNAWIKVLNKFDDIMNEIIREYNVEKLQLNPFSALTKGLLSEILRFERLLLENSTNRKTFSSYDRLNSLLSSSDLDILILALKLLLRPSQQYSAQPAVSHALSISTPRLQSLAKRWPYLRENNINLVDLVSSKGTEELEGIPQEAREVDFSFYRTAGAIGAETDKNIEDMQEMPRNTPSKQTIAPNSTIVHLRLDEQMLNAKPVVNVLGDAIEAFSVPESETFELLCRIRAATSLSKLKKLERKNLVIVRLLAIAIFGHTHVESQATSALFLYEPDLIAQISELLHVDRGVSVMVQTAAIAALDALARYKTRLPEVLTAVNAGVNHGVLMALVRNMVVDISNPDSRLPHTFVESVLSFITYISSHASGGNMVVGAGLIPLLIQIMENRSPQRLPLISKTMQLVDNVLYSFSNAFGLFCSSRGVEVLVERIEYEIGFDVDGFATLYHSCAISGLGELPIQRLAILKHILRSMHRMMQSSGTAEGLRGLIDMSLLKSIKKIIDYRGLFGSNIFPLAINIMSTFVHNEPTSLSIIQEAGLPDMFYKALEIGIEPAVEVIQAIPNAIGALCLNESGQAQLLKRPSIIPAIFSIFTSEQHRKVLADKENAVIIGTAVDELIRHHPALKSRVFDALTSTLRRIEDLGTLYSPSQNIEHFYRLISIYDVAVPDNDITMKDDIAQEEAPTYPFAESVVDDPNEGINANNHDNLIISYIDLVGRFLEGFFQHPPHCKDFVTTTDGLQRFGRITGLPCLPYDFANSVASDSMVQVLRTMTEVATSETLLHLTEIVQASLMDTQFFWDSADEHSKLLTLVDLLKEETDVANTQFRSLVVLHIRITLLSDVFATAGQAQGRSAISLLQALMSSSPLKLLTDLGSLHRASVWENIIFQTGLTSKGIELSSSSSSPSNESPPQAIAELPSVDALVPAHSPVENSHAENLGNERNTALKASKHEDPRHWNASSLRHITQGLPNALAPFFQAMVKMYHARRNPDADQKKQIIDSSKIVADIMLNHLKIQHFDNQALHNYYSIILAFFTLLLVDERTSTSTLHTVQLFSFYQTGGFEVLFDICSTIYSKIDQIFKIKEDERSEIEKKELLQAYGALKVALHLIYPIISSKTILESAQTPLIVTRDKAEADPDYFEPHNFLVKLRSAALPTLRSLWEVTWLSQAPIGVSRFIVRSVLEVANGEDEESKLESSISDLGSAPPTIIRPSGPDEARIRILTDMGFPRSAAERALNRTHNNVNSATELLLSHPFPLPPDPMPEHLQTAVAEPIADTQIQADSDETPQSPPTEDNEYPLLQEPADPSSGSSSQGRTVEEWRATLEEAREPLRASISRQALLLIDEDHSDALFFDLHVAFTKSSKHQEHAVRSLVDDIKTFSAFAYDLQQQPLANRCRLLALVLCEKPTSIDQALRNTLLDHLLALLLSSIDPTQPPRWLAAHLLVTEALFTLAEEPRTIILPKENEITTNEAIPVGPPRKEARSIVFDFCLRLLAVDDLPPDELLSVFRLFVLLTRDEELAAQFVQRDGLISLFNRVRASAINGGSSYIVTILRHLVEDSSIIRAIMELNIKRYFTQSRSKSIELTSFVRNSSAIALRDVDNFIDATKHLCELEHPYSSTPLIKLNDAVTYETDKPPQATEPHVDMQVDSCSSTSDFHFKSVESVIHTLVTELMNAVKLIHETPEIPIVFSSQPGTDSTKSTSETQSKTQSDDPNPKVELQDKHQYLCFLMQCLTELLFSYDVCKSVFLSYSAKRRSHPPHSKDINKFRNATLHFLLSDLIAYGNISPSPDNQYRSRESLCSWAMNVIGALCVDPSSGQETKEVSMDLIFVRKFVLETISRAIKDVSTSTDHLDARYGRLLALADLCYRLLTVRVNSSRKTVEEIPTHLAKIMLEKNFVAVLTTALSEVDLNYPNVRNLVAAILRPLEYLTKIAIKMSRTGKVKEDDRPDDSATSDSEDEEDDIIGENREETPDLYRNSALGMYAGGMDDGDYSEGEVGNQDVEMYGDETGSEDTSASDSDSEDQDLDHVTRVSGEAWDEVDDEDDLVENRELDQGEGDRGDDDENEEDDNEEVDDDEGMRWEDMQNEADSLGIALENLDDESGHGVPIQVTHEEDEPEMVSDEEEFVIGNAHFSNDGIFNFGDAFINTGVRDAGGLFFHRRHRGNDQPPFGRSRNAPAAPETTTHPLLLDMSAASRVNNGQNRVFRHAPTIIGNGPPGFLQTIDEMLGEGSLQMLQQIISREGGMAETFRIEVPAGTILHHGRRILGSSSRIERVPRTQGHRPGREFDPLLTLQRWAEESKILHGDFVSERLGKLSNHVALAMLPAALEAIKKAKLREEEEASKKADEIVEDVKQESSKEAVSDGLPAETVKNRDSLPPDSSTSRLNELQLGQEDLTMADSGTPDMDTLMVDASEVLASPSTSTPLDNENAANVADETTGPSSSNLNSNLPTRITVLIHGSAVDITDTGIDPTFLEALPDDMREEVLNQHVRDQQASRVQQPPDSQISSEFLDALPPEIRAEIIQQEAMERARRRNDEPSRNPPAQAADIDPASFIASLDPTLRQAVLLDQDDGFIQSLPSHMIAEAGVYRDEFHASRSNVARNPIRTVVAGVPGRKLPLQHDAILLLDRSSVAVLVRLLFFPQVLKKNLLFKILVNLCENSKTRTDLFNILLSILQDGTADLAAVDKSFSQMSVRNRDGKPQTPKALGKQKATSEPIPMLNSSAYHIEIVPDLIAQRCLEALTYIVSANEISSLFFLTEHEIPTGFRKSSSKKGKGKEKLSSYPLVLLLNLLDRHSLLRTPTVLESVVSLLASVTRPLTGLKDQTRVDGDSQQGQQPSHRESEVVEASEQNLSGIVSSEPSLAQTAASHVNSNVVSSEDNSSNVEENAGPSGPKSLNKPSGEPTEDKPVLEHPPQIPNGTLRLIVNILTVGECSGRTFQQSLALIQHLSYIPDSRDIIALELKSKAQEFGQILLSDLDELAFTLQESPINVMISSVATKFSPASSTQAKLLRVLKTIDYMFSPKTSSTMAKTTAVNDDIEKVQSIYESFRFTPLWRRLGDCLSIVSDGSDIAPIGTVLLPLIEALMVVCKFAGSKGPGSVPRALRISTSPKSPTTARESMEELFISFTDAHRKILNLMVRNNPSLMSGSFSLLVSNSRVLDFDNKRNYFNQQLHRKPHVREHYGTLQLNVRRARVFEDSFLYLQRKTGEQIKNGKLSVRFYDEEGVDAGGLTREWFQILARQMFNPNNALFQPCAADKLTYQPNKNSWVNPEHLSFFKFVGRVIGKAIYDGRLLDAYFARSLYRQLLGKPVDYRDVEWVDPEYYNSLCWILENDPTALDLTFSVEADEFGVSRIVPLTDGGDSIPVTQDSKREFVQLSAQYRLYSSIKEQIENLSSGFYEIIPKDLITIFNEQELELLISGTPDIDVDEWRAATEYNGYSSSDPNVVWWWRALKSFNREERAKVLSFATGTSRVPLSGFVDLQGVQGVQKFSIHRAYGEPDRLPQAHTCFNQIDLPQYSSYEMLRQQLLMAINEGGEGFAFS